MDEFLKYSNHIPLSIVSSHFQKESLDILLLNKDLPVELILKIFKTYLRLSGLRSLCDVPLRLLYTTPNNSSGVFVQRTVASCLYNITQLKST